MKKVNLLAAAVLAAAFAMPAQANYTPNAYFGGYFRSGVMNKHFNKTDDLVHRVGRLGAENDTYGEIFLGADVATVDDTVWTVNSRLAVSAQYNRDWQSTDNWNGSVDKNGNFSKNTNNTENFRIALREFNLNVKGIFDWDKDASLWAGKRFYHREDLHITDMYYYDISGMGAGIENVSLADGKLSVAWLRRDDSASYKSNFDGTSVTVNGGKPEFASVHMIDVQYDHALWDGANLELRGTYFIPQRDTNDNAKQWYSATADYDNAQLFAAELTQGFSAGWNKTVVQFAHGSNVKWGAFGTPAWLDTDGDSNHAYRWTLINTGDIHFTPDFGLNHVFYASYASGYDNNVFFNAKNANQYTGKRKSDTSVQLVVRPYYRLTKMTRLYVEAGFYAATEKNYTYDSKYDVFGTANTTSQGQKYTLAYAITPDAGNFWSRPELRFFVTYLHGNENGQDFSSFGSVGGSLEQNGQTIAQYSNTKTSNTLFGVQAEAWW